VRQTKVSEARAIACSELRAKQQITLRCASCCSAFGLEC